MAKRHCFILEVVAESVIVIDPQNPTQLADYLIKGGTLVTMDAKRRVIENGAIAIRGAEIVSIGPAVQIAEHIQARQTIDASGCLVIPGLINVHSHLAMTIFRGLVDDQPLEAWLGRIWPLEAAFANVSNVRAGTQLALVEMIRGGVTCAHDMYWQLWDNTRTAVNAGFRLVNGPAFTEIVGPDGVMPENHIPRAQSYIEEFRTNPLVTCCVQVHSTYTTSRQMLENARQISEDYQLLFVTHASESRVEVETIQQRFGKTPIEYLHEVGLLGPRTLLAHCVHLRDAEIQLLKDTSTSVAHCPESNLKLSNGVARLPDLLRAGVNVAIGTDGAATNNDLDMLGEMFTAAMVHKGVWGDPTCPKAEHVFEMATVKAARAIGMQDRLGSLETGKLADIAILDLDAPHLTPLYNVYSHLIYAANKCDVRSVFIHGKPVMLNRDLLTLDEEEIKFAVRRVAMQINSGSQG